MTWIDEALKIRNEMFYQIHKTEIDTMKPKFYAYNEENMMVHNVTDAELGESELSEEEELNQRLMMEQEKADAKYHEMKEGL